MRYIIELTEENSIVLSKLKNSKNNDRNFFKTKRIALKHFRQTVSMFDHIGFDSSHDHADDHDHSNCNHE
jgi:hypothetical protein